MKKIHYLAGLLITTFIGIHLLNHSLSVFGADVHIDFMNKLRLVYRNPVVELILLLAVLSQIVSGLKMFTKNRKKASNFFEQLQNWTGLYLAIFFMIHIGAVLVGRLFLDLDTNFYFGVAGLNTFPLNLFFIPYYGLAILSFFRHISAIHYQKMNRKLTGITVENQSRFILLVGVIVTIVILYGSTNGFTGVAIPIEYQMVTGK